MSYRVQVLPESRKTLAKLPTSIATRLVQLMEDLADQPRPLGAIKLKGIKDTYRVRLGDYRIVYEIKDRQLVVLVIRIGHRKDVYRKGK